MCSKRLQWYLQKYGISDDVTGKVYQALSDLPDVVLETLDEALVTEIKHELAETRKTLEGVTQFIGGKLYV